MEATVRGSVLLFDEGRGLGVVRCDDGRELGFHCTAIGDGSRTVDPGAEVFLRVVPGHDGRWEASGIAVVPAGGARDDERPKGADAVVPVT